MMELVVIEITLKALIKFILWCIVCGITVFGFTYIVFVFIYCAKVVTKAGDKEIKHWVSSFMFKNANIDTGYRNKPNRYPVFTTKEECLQWLKG